MFIVLSRRIGVEVGGNHPVRVLGPALENVSMQLPAETMAVQLIIPSLTVTVPVGVPLPGKFTVTP